MLQRPCPASPYVGLVPYTEADAPFFKGRDAECNIIIENLRASRLTLLYGSSGVGKSSVLHAGVVHKLRELTRQSVEQLGEPEFAVVIFSGWRDDPIAGLMRCVQESVASALNVKALEPVPASLNLSDMLKAWTDRFGIHLLIILDQFEEYFQYRGDETGEGTFAFEFPRAVNRADLPAKFLISIRDDGLSRLDRFKTQLPNLFVNLLRINQMNGEAAKRAIELPLETYNDLCVPEGEERYRIEKDLVIEILKQIKAKPKLTPRDDDKPLPHKLSELASEVTGTPDDELALENLFVETPYLQLVMTRLWEKERDEHSRVLRFDTLKKLKGLENIIQVYLGESLHQLSPAQRRVAARAFDYLVTASGTKVAYMESDLATRLQINYDIAPTDLREVLISLHKSRILRAVEPPLDRRDESRYEVFHDVLALAILKWQDTYIAATKAAEAEQKHRTEEQAKLRQKATVILSIAALLLTVMSIVTLIQSLQAKKALNAEKQARTLEQEASDLAEKRREEAERALELAETSTKEAIASADKAEKNKKTAEEATILAKKRLEEIKKLQDELRQTAKKLTLEEEDPEKQQQMAKLFGISLPKKITNAQQSSVTSTQKRESETGREVSGNQGTIQKKLWANGRTLHIRFLNGTPEFQEKVRQVAQEWTQFANIKFAFDQSPTAEIRVTFNDLSNPAWSYLGTDALAVPKSEPTMNLSILKARSATPQMIKKTILLEFGHVLGLISEHNNPNATIPWNVEYLQKVFGPDYANRYFAKDSGAYRPFDPNSVMALEFPKEYFLSEFKMGGGTELSESDKELVRKLYPR